MRLEGGLEKPLLRLQTHCVRVNTVLSRLICVSVLYRDPLKIGRGTLRYLIKILKITKMNLRHIRTFLGGAMVGAVSFSAHAQSGNTTANSVYLLGASYEHGPLSMGAAVLYLNPTSATADSGFFTNNANGASTLSGSLNRGYASANAYRVAVARIKYTIDQFELTTSYSNTQYSGLAQSFLGGTARFNNVDFAVKYAYRSFLSFYAVVTI